MTMIAPSVAARRVDNLHPRCCHAHEGGHPVPRSRGRENGTRRKRNANRRGTRTTWRARPHLRPHGRRDQRATELRDRLATFLTMAYIMFVNPAIVEKAGMDHGAVFVSTSLAAALSTAIMGLYANYPIALAPGTGL